MVTDIVPSRPSRVQHPDINNPNLIIAFCAARDTKYNTEYAVDSDLNLNLSYTPKCWTFNPVWQ